MRIAVLLAVIAALVGCGAGASASAADSTNLKITFWPQGHERGDAKTWTLRCDPNGGTLPKVAAACDKLGALKAPFGRISPRAMCTEIYGGPQEAQIVGTFGGKRIWIALSAKNGCQISRAKKLGFLVPGFNTNPNA